MNICSPQLGLSSESILGGEVFDGQILSGLSKKKIAIQVILPRGAKHLEANKYLTFTHIPFVHFPAVLFNFFLVFPMFKLHRQNKIDIIRLHQPQFTGLGAIFFKLFNKDVKIVATYHQFPESKFWILSKFLNNYWDHIICDSMAVRDKLHSQYQIPLNQITVVHNGVPAYLWPEAKDEKLIDRLKLKNKSILLFVGLFIPRKNPLFLLKVLIKILTAYPSTVLIFWGDGPLKNDIQKESRNLKIEDKIRFFGPTFGPEKRKLHNVADIFVHPALDEGFALTPLESMACAKPVLMNSSHSAREAVQNGYNGYICKTNDVDSWVESLKLLLGNRKRTQAMGKNSLKKVKKEFNWQIAVDQHEKVFNTIT